MDRRSTAAETHRAGAWVGRFHDRYPWLGPLLFVSSALYFYAQIVVAWVFGPPAYSVITNTISDLGNTTCGRYDNAYVCSPRHTLMNAAFIFLGLVMVAGSALLYQEFTTPGRERAAAVVGFGLMALAGLGSILVGAFPENTNGALHITGAGLAIGAGNVGIFILGVLLTLPEAMRRYMLLFSVTSLTALVLFAAHRYFGIGAGTMERIAAYPETIWLISFGLFVWRSHRQDQPVPAA